MTAPPSGTGPFDSAPPSAALRSGRTDAVRDARPEDNQALIALTAACPMQGDVGLCSNRAPDFFALNRLEGEKTRVGVVEGEGGTIAGCVAVADRVAYLRGEPVRVAYASDLKVHPGARRGPAADSLTRFVADTVREWGGEERPILLTVLGGNRSMERRSAGPRGIPGFLRFATIRAQSISLLWKRRPPADVDVEVRRAEEKDVPEMAALWAKVAPHRQFAPVMDAAALLRFMKEAPGLSVSSYFVARRRQGGQIAGFFALWDQSCFKQMVVTGYSFGLGLFRIFFNVLATLVGGTRLPPVGAPMRYMTAVNVCVPGEEPGVLRALAIHAYNELRGKGYSFFTIGLDAKDPLQRGLDGLMAQPTDICAFATTATGSYKGPALDDRPVHFEIALV